MPTLQIDRFERTAREDFEFTREIRYFDGQIELTAGDESYHLVITDGALAGAHTGPADDAACRIRISGPELLWQEMLADKPTPFHQCLQSTAVRHGLQMSDTNETFAYLPALNRMLQILRTLHNEEN